MEFNDFDVEYYTDGSCLKNGQGGYGVVKIQNDQLISTYCSSAINTTNNRMELSAIIYALKDYYKNNQQKAVIYTDSAYCSNMLNNWIYMWHEKDWKLSSGKPVENLDLVKEAFDLIKKTPYVTISKVKGHNDNAGNELADALATNNKSKIQKISESF